MDTRQFDGLSQRHVIADKSKPFTERRDGAKLNNGAHNSWSR
ncbi:hypothetical protein POX_h09408 [Penicillium oxalicum]|uniref:Uncharacterized protein n=1 Tax=Penicillium oxalicum (strain 114-2 / CGMCC 5302) TaxID=933388 RepID=S8AXM6_PENO1|nr:hypothetical protein POX_h09408 [Penicillium oxalicum]EPS31108.1 hypothetical protein PDE_06063 [Penicillium oxalicum 114-2]KAI2785650.1 hypothetical protein POX_h09408 [Penicillium oxalicum]